MARTLAREHAIGPPTTAVEMLKRDQERSRAGAELADLYAACDIVRAHLDENLVQDAVACARKVYRRRGLWRRVKSSGWRSVSVVLSGGPWLVIRSPYLRPTGE